MRRAQVHQHSREQRPVARRVVLRVDVLQGAVGEAEERDPQHDGREQRLEADGVGHLPRITRLLYHQILKLAYRANTMSEALSLGLAHPSILDAFEHFYRTEVFQQNARLREALVEKQAETRQMRHEIDYLEETCRLYAMALCSPARRPFDI